MDKELFVWVAARLAALGDAKAAWILELVRSLPSRH